MKNKTGFHISLNISIFIINNSLEFKKKYNSKSNKSWTIDKK